MPAIGDIKQWIEQFVVKFRKGNSGEIILYDANGYPQKATPSFATTSQIWNTRWKTADETISSDSTLTADNTLVFPMLANKKYAFRMMAVYSTTSAADFKYRHAGPGSPTFVFIRRKHTAATATSDSVGADTAYSAADITALTTSNGSGIVELRGVIHNGANAGNFEFQWAQNTLNAGDTTVHAGSYIEYKQVD